MDDSKRESALRGLGLVRNGVTQAASLVRSKVTDLEGKIYQVLDGMETELKFGDIVGGFDGSGLKNPWAGATAGTDTTLEDKYNYVRSQVLEKNSDYGILDDEQMEMWRAGTNKERFVNNPTFADKMVLEIVYKAFKNAEE
jgi:hypothetical protein